MRNDIAIKPTHTPAELRRLAARVKDAKQCRRLLSIAAALEGTSPGEAARVRGMNRQTLRDWVHRFNAQGLEGQRSLPPAKAGTPVAVATRAG